MDLIIWLSEANITKKRNKVNNIMFLLCLFVVECGNFVARIFRVDLFSISDIYADTVITILVYVG